MKRKIGLFLGVVLLFLAGGLLLGMEGKDAVSVRQRSKTAFWRRIRLRFPYSSRGCDCRTCAEGWQLKEEPS